MDCHLQGINLLCQDIQKQCAFISFLFDVEIHFDKNARFFYLGQTKFNLVQGFSKADGAHPHFELCVGKIEDLKNFKQKLELFTYKSQGSRPKTSFNQNTFEFEDPSGNLWRVNCGDEARSFRPPNTTLM